jgi:hypothetical protein
MSNHESELAARSTAPRITLERLNSLIKSEFYTTADRAFGAAPSLPEMRLLTLCVLVMTNGYTVIGKSACASPENFDAEYGKVAAREDAIEQLWPLEGYRLRQALHDAGELNRMVADSFAAPLPSFDFSATPAEPATPPPVAVIEPSVGRVVWFWPTGKHEGVQPCAAIVTYVHGSRCVNLAVFEANGSSAGYTSVRLHQPGDVPEEHGSWFAEWMPFQVGQARATRALAETRGNAATDPVHAAD